MKKYSTLTFVVMMLILISGHILFSSPRFTNSQSESEISTVDFIKQAAKHDSFQVLYTLKDAEYPIENDSGAQWSANIDGTRLLTWVKNDLGGRDNQVRVWDIAAGAELFTLFHPGMNGATWSSDGTRILTWTSFADDGEIKEFEYEGSLFPIYQVPMADGKTQELALVEKSRISSRFIDPANPNAGLIEWEGRWRILNPVYERVPGITKVWDAVTGEEILSLIPNSLSDLSVDGAAWNEDGTRILTWGAAVRVWDAATGTELLTIDEFIVGATWNPDGTRILIYSEGGIDYGGVVQIWDAATGTELLTLFTAPGIRGIAWSNNNTILAWSQDGAVRVWNASTGAELLTLNTELTIRDIAWNIDGTRVLAWSADSTVHIWDVATGEKLLVLTQLQGAKWSIDATCILTWSDDGVVQIWEVSTGEELLSISHESEIVLSAMWIAGDTRILTWSDNQIIRVLGEP